MQEYISKQQQVLRPAEQIYAVISRFDNLTPALADKVEEWQATEDSLFVQGQRLHRETPHGGARAGQIRQGRRRRRGRTDGFRILDPVAGSLRRGHPPAAGGCAST